MMRHLVDDAASIAALTQSILHYLYRMHRERKYQRVYSRFLIDQNRWRAMRYGFDEGLVDFDTAQVVPVADRLEQIVEMVRIDAEELGCSAELENALEIPSRGTSAHLQIDTYERACQEGKAPAEALRDVVDMLIEETVKNL